MKRLGFGRARIWGLGSVIVVMTLAAACSSAAGQAGLTATQAAGRPGTRPAAAALDAQRAAYGSVVLGGSPGTPAANPRTGTLYVPK